MEISKSYDGKARNYTGLNYNAAQRVSGLEKCCLHKGTESLIPLLPLHFLSPSAIHSFTHVHSYLHSLILHLSCTQHWGYENKQHTDPAFNLLTLPEKKNIQFTLCTI